MVLCITGHKLWYGLPAGAANGPRRPVRNRMAGLGGMQECSNPFNCYEHQPRCPKAIFHHEVHTFVARSAAEKIRNTINIMDSEISELIIRPGYLFELIPGYLSFPKCI